MSASNVPTHEIGRDLDIDDENIDETWDERLWGLTEMFPERLRTLTGKTASGVVELTTNGVSFARKAAWIGATSFVFLVLPYVVIKEYVDFTHMTEAQQKAMLLGPGVLNSAAK